MLTIDDMCGQLVQNNLDEMKEHECEHTPEINEAMRRLVRKETISASLRALIDADL